MNYALFLLLNAPAHPRAPLPAIATFCAEYVICVLPAMLVVRWLRGGEDARERLPEATRQASPPCSSISSAHGSGSPRAPS